MSATTFAQALDRATAEAMRADPRVFFMATAPPAPLLEEFGDARVRCTPIAESAMTGMAVGAAGAGMRPIVHWSCVNFSYVAFDQVVNQAARNHYMFGGQRAFPIVFRARYLNGTRSAAQHSQTGYALYAHAAGLKLAVPSGPLEAWRLMRAAVEDPNPVIVFEAQRLTAAEETVDEGTEPLPLGRAVVKRSGADVTIVAIGYMVGLALEAARDLEALGISAEVIDPRTIVPLDLETIAGSVARTGRLLVVDESFPVCSVASEIVASVVADGESMAALRSPPTRLCTAPVPIPYSASLEDHVLPGRADIVAHARRLAGDGA